MIALPCGPHDKPYLPSINHNLIGHHHHTIKFTASWSAEEVTFLNTNVSLKDSLIGAAFMSNPWTSTNTSTWIVAIPTLQNFYSL